MLFFMFFIQRLTTNLCPEHLNQNSFVRNNPSIIIDCFLFFKPGEIYCSPKMMRYEEENEKLADSSPCAGVRADLKMCLLESDCCRVLKKTPRECLKSEDGTVPTECQVLRNTFFECKRSLLDNRQRFRGRKGY